jgi:hypothetical protein
MGEIQRPDFTYEDFASGRVFEYLTGIESAYKQSMEERELANLAKELKFSNFKKSLSAYRKDLKKASLKIIQDDGVTDFAEQELELNSGEWTADESGIWRYGRGGSIEYACTHPIMPTQVLKSIDTGMVKVKLAYRRSYNSKRPWQEIIVPTSKISKASDIIALADNGVSVTSGERAQALVDYLRDIMDRNQDLIPEVKSVSRMGWNEDGFAPYNGDAVFDSADRFKSIYQSIKAEGSMGAWMEEALDARAYSLTSRIVLASSFASVLVEPLGCLPFFIHLWGMDSGTGKSVSQMLAASVWADPRIGGGFFPTFKSTSVGIELIAGFLHSLPLFLDELQLSKDKHGNIIFNVYELASGSGKLRGNKNLGLDYIPQWANCFITSGETPLVGENDGAGALNRVVEIECRANEKAIRDGHRTANVVKANYGHAGPIFIEKLMEEGQLDRAKDLYESYYTDCVNTDTTEKQAMAAAIILTADHLATEWIFKDGRELTVSELSEFLKSKETVSASERGYDYMCDWVASNINHFQEEKDTVERYGVIENNVAIINRSVFNSACAEGGISAKALLSHLRTKGKLILGPKGFTKAKRIGGISVHCVWLVLPSDDEETSGLLPDM